ncbi:type-F conjugative transfer system pilin assembly protein TraF [Legionella sp. 28fT52]|uniref:type-F conjugative transfer system pilin assembly protein TraF n=1 Tax=Legionella sp. 28fT52 TaxID=3410134 RepID=UPI003AF888F5
MIKPLIMILLGLLTLTAHASERPVGFLWYSLPKEESPQKEAKQQGKPFNQLSFSERDAVLHFYTMEALHKARQTKKVEDMRAFLSLQDYWLAESSRFKALFQKTLLAYPQYDYTVTHPVSQAGVRLTEERRERLHIKRLKQLANTQGFLFFYRGKSAYDLKQIPILLDFCKTHQFSLIAVSVDGVKAESLPDTRLDRGQANQLGVRYFPALLLANPASGKTKPVAYGLFTQDMLLTRLNQVATHFNGEDE